MNEVNNKIVDVVPYSSGAAVIREDNSSIVWGDGGGVRTSATNVVEIYRFSEKYITEGTDSVLYARLSDGTLTQLTNSFLDFTDIPFSNVQSEFSLANSANDVIDGRVAIRNDGSLVIWGSECNWSRL